MYVAYPASLLAEARRHAEAGWTAPEIRRILISEDKPAPAVETLKCWIDPAYRDSRCGQAGKLRHRSRASNANFRLSSQTDQYQLQFALRLNEVGVQAPSIARVMAVMFDDAPDETKVRSWLRDRRIPRGYHARTPA